MKSNYLPLITCSEFSIVNIHANTMVSSLTASSPNTQVKPNKGNKETAANSNVLQNNNNKCTCYISR